MRRSYKKVRPKKHFVYSVDELMDLFGICRNTVSNWVSEGLRPSDLSRPYVFRGAEVTRFRDSRKLLPGTPLRIGQFKCLACSERVFPVGTTVVQRKQKKGAIVLLARCPDCGGCTTKIVNETDCDKIMQCVITNTSLDSLDEESGPAEAGIGKVSPPENANLCFLNDRILYDWLKYAGRWSPETIDAKLAAIRQFEKFCDGRAFAQLSKNDVTHYRDYLKSRVEAHDDQSLSASTVRHSASHVKSFLEWLIEQPKCGRLDRSLPKHLTLPKKFDAVPLSMEKNPTPTVDEAERMINLMPQDTIKGRRDRGMVAIAFLGALRADTITSLLIKHLDIENRIIVQDARQSRTKNGKSLRVKFFPLPPVFVEVLEDWMEELMGLGFHPEDALFPDDRYLAKNAIRAYSDRVKAMASTHAISSAFKLASRLVEKQFSPHSAKHCIGQLGLVDCKTPEQTKAWSQNMGHEGEDITQRYYLNIPENGVHEIIEELGRDGIDTGTEDDKELLVSFFENRLTPGTPEHLRGRLLAHEREKARLLAEGIPIVDDTSVALT